MPSRIVVRLKSCDDIMGNLIIYTWGIGEHGALGQISIETCWKPTKVAALESCKIVGVSCGIRHTAIVDDTGLLYMCGSGDAGQLGTGTRDKE